MFKTELNEIFDFTNTCRLCLNQTNEFTSIFTMSSLEIQYLVIINECTSLKIVENDKLPKIICLECVDCLNKFYKFRKLVVNSEHRLNAFLNQIHNNLNENVTGNTCFIKEEMLDYDLNEKSYIPTCLIKSEENSFDFEQVIEFESKTEIVKEELEIDENEPISLTFNFGDETKTEAFNQEEGSDQETNQSIFNFKSCPQTFTEETNSNNFEEIHQNIDPHNSTQHKKLKNHKKSFICNQCNKSFTTSSSLKQHKLVHTGEKPYGCDQCEKFFAALSNLKKHKKVHTGEKPFICEHCGKSFNQSTNFKIHKRIHSGEKPYSCKQCGKSFNQWSNLKTHQLYHSGEKAFICKQCGKAFSEKSTLKRHRVTHTGERPYSCKQCGELFAYAITLKRHHVKVHKPKCNK